MLGVAVLALPRVTALLGIGTTAIVLAAVALLTYLSLHSLTLASSRSGVVRYSDVVQNLLGTFWQALLDLSLIVNCAGILVIALIVVGDILVGKKGADGLLSAACGDRQTVLTVATVILIAPLVSVTRLRSVAGASMLGVLAILGWALITLFLFLAAWSNDELHAVHWWPKGSFVGHGFKSAVLVLGTVPIIFVAFICQMSLQHTMRDLQYVRDTQVDKMTAVGVALVAGTYALIAICSYALFGRDVEADVLRNFTVDSLAPLVWIRLAHAGESLRVGYFGVSVHGGGAQLLQGSPYSGGWAGIGTGHPPTGMGLTVS